MSRTLRRSLVIVLLAAVGYGGWRLFSFARDKALRDASKSNLKLIGLALHNYHEQYGSFPPAYVPGPDDKPWHSWRVLLLPFLGEAELYSKYRFDEPWDGPHNATLLQLGPKIYTSPLQKSERPGTASYLAVVSRRTMWPAYFPVSIQDVTDGSSNTIQLVEAVDGDIGWSEPRDLRERQALALLKPKPPPSRFAKTPDSFHILMGDGSVRRLSTQVNRQLFIALITPRATELMIDDERWPKGLLSNETPTAAKLPDVVPLDRFPGTRLLVAPEEDIEADQTWLYSATVQIAWDQLRPRPGEPVTTHEASPVVAVLNSHPFPVEALDEECYFAAVSGLDAQGRQDLLSRFRQKFPTAPTELRQPSRNKEGLGNGLHVWVYMKKSMPFADVMERFPKPLSFPAQEPSGHVESFGWPSAAGEGGGFPVLQQTVAIQDYVSDEEFIVSLQTESPQGDEIILASIAPEKNLQQTWERVANRMRQPQGKELLTHLRGIDRLQIPILSFGIDGALHQLVGLPIPQPGHPDRFIAEAWQLVQFRLDEYGAELIADTQIIVGENGHGPELRIKPLIPRQFVFDQPFLLALRERDAKVPYFLAWIGNADLMEPAK